ncbi:MAG: SDR family NAD(P)-dependent oxidoreductase [Saprospiraceae bacterium]
MKNPLSKTIFITGATSGIGKASAILFAKRGYNVIIAGRRKERLTNLKDKLQKKYATNVASLCFDIRKKEEVKKAWNRLDSSWKKIDILLNNAGLAKGLTPIHKGKLNDWEQMIDTNIKGLLYITRLVSPVMVKANKGHIINICSTAGHEVYPNGNVYSGTKFAVDALTKSMRLDLHKFGLRVSQVSPGHVENTEFAKVRFNGNDKKSKIYEDFTPLSSKDVAEIILFIASRKKHINIQDILVMGSQQASSNMIDRSGRI